MTEAAKIPKRGSDGSQHTSRDIAAAFVEVAQLVPYARNARTHSDAQVAQLAASIVEWGWTNPILADAKGIVAGHGRLAAARLLYGQGRVLNLPNGEDIPAGCVPVIDVTGWTETKRRAYVLADNQLAMNAGWDDAMLVEELRSIRDDGFDLALVGFDELPALDDPEPTGDPEQVPDAPATPRSQHGDLWLLGNHRLLCGDSTSMDDLAKLTSGQLVDMWLTDPPYNVAYEGGTKEKLTIKNDSMADDQFRQFLRDSYTAADTVMKPGAVFYIWFADVETYNFTGAARDAGWKVRQTLIWKKSSMILGRRDYHWQHEPCLYGWKDGAAHLWTADRKQTTILEFDKPSRNGDHPTMKPVALFEYQMLNNTQGGDKVLDSFGGSGTTLIAAEKNGRTAFLMELDPRFCDVIVERWQEFTGKRALREDGVPFDEVGPA